MFDSIYNKKKVLITGNTGFKGSWLSIWLLKLGAEVYGISKDIPTNPSIFENLNLNEKINDFRIDIRDYEAVMKVITQVKPDFVFHLAAQPIVSISYNDPLNTLSSNIIGTANILEVLRVMNHKCNAVIITSDKCYDNVEWVWGYKESDFLGGKDIYSGSKGAAELVFKSYFHSFFKKESSNVKIVSARAGNVIGGGDWALDRIVPDCIRAWSIQKPVEIRNPLSTRPWQHVLEPLSGYLALGAKLAENPLLNGESFNFGPKSDSNYTVQQIIEDLCKYWNFSHFEKAYNVKKNEKFHEAGLLKLNCDKALFYLNWLPTLEYEKLIEFTSVWYYQFYNKNNNMFDYTTSQINEYESVAKVKKISWAKK